MCRRFGGRVLRRHLRMCGNTTTAMLLTACLRAGVRGPGRNMRVARCVVRQMAFMMSHHGMKLVPSMENICPMIAMCIELAMAPAIRARNPDVCRATDKHNIAVGNNGDRRVIRHRGISLLNHYGRRRRCEHTLDHRIDIGINDELPLWVRYTACK